MKKTIVYFYSKKGNNRFLAKKISEKLNGDIEEIRPRLNGFILILMGLTAGIRKLKKQPGDYDRVILCGPVFMGRFISPLRQFAEKHKPDIREMVFVTCCASGFKQKNEKFGHGLVFNRVREILGDRCVHCEAFPISLVLPEDQRENPDMVMKTRLSEENFRGEIETRFNQMISKLNV